MTIVYLEVKPHKLSNRELAKVFETLKRQGLVSDTEDRKLKTTTGKSYYVRQNHKYVTIRIPQDKIDAFIERTRIDDSDIRSVRGGISRDLTALEQQLEEEESAPDYNYPSLPLIATGDPHKSILETITKMDEKPFNLEENTNRDDNLNVTLSTLYDVEESPADIGEISMIKGNENQDSVEEEPTEPGTESTAVNAPVVPVLLSAEAQHAANRQTGSDFKLDAGLSIPVWRKTDQSEETVNTRMYIRDLQRLKTLGVLPNEALLINASLVKSGRTSLYEELPAEAETSVDELAKYLRKAYGMNRFDMYKEVQNVKQGPSENPHSFLSRVITLYYEAKGKTKKTIEDIKQNEDETYEIVGLFWRGLFDQRVRVALKQRMDGLKFEEMADITKNIESSYKDLDGSSVNLVHTEADDETDANVLHINNMRYKQHDGKTAWKSRNPKAIKKCWSCGRPGHIARFCWKMKKENIGIEH